MQVADGFAERGDSGGVHDGSLATNRASVTRAGFQLRTLPLDGACKGGNGTLGGQGGAGGGGLGGHSIGIAYTGMAPAMMTNVTVTVGKAGPGGAGGDGGAGNQGGKGDDGVSEKVKGFDAK